MKHLFSIYLSKKRKIVFYRSYETIENFICNFTKPDRFGILCEYQFKLKEKYNLDNQLYGNMSGATVPKIWRFTYGDIVDGER